MISISYRRFCRSAMIAEQINPSCAHGYSRRCLVKTVAAVTPRDRRYDGHQGRARVRNIYFILRESYGYPRARARENEPRVVRRAVTTTRLPASDDTRLPAGGTCSRNRTSTTARARSRAARVTRRVAFSSDAARDDTVDDDLRWTGKVARCATD